MDINQKMQAIEESILSLPEEEITYLLIAITKRVQNRRLGRGSDLKKELGVIGHEHDKLNAFIKSEMAEA